ncbi:MAG: right-handed parallel beta-helix repeat-containing protein [Thermogutta sp.]
MTPMSWTNRLAIRELTGFFLLLGIAAIVLVARPSAGRDIFVNNEQGDDSFTGGVATPGHTVDGPVRSISRALSLAQPGDRIVLAKTGTPYQESITFAGSRLGRGILDDLILEGNGAILDGSAPIPGNAWEPDRDAWKRTGRAVFRFLPERKSYQQLFLGDRPATRVYADRLAAIPPDLEPLQWCLFQGSIYFCVEPDRHPQDYPLRYAKLPVGITLHHVQGVTIRDLVVQGFQLDGISLANTAREVRLERVVLRGNGRAGLTVGGASHGDLTDSLLGDNGEAQILTLPNSELRVHNCQILGNTAPAWVDRGGRFFLEGKPQQGSLDQIDTAANAEGNN